MCLDMAADNSRLKSVLVFFISLRFGSLKSFLICMSWVIFVIKLPARVLKEEAKNNHFFLFAKFKLKCKVLATLICRIKILSFHVQKLFLGTNVTCQKVFGSFGSRAKFSSLSSALRTVLGSRESL